MPSFDVVSEVDLNELTNAVDQCAREVGNRYDFKGTSARIDREGDAVVIFADSEFQLNQVLEIFYARAAKRGIDVAAIEEGKLETISGDKAKQVLAVRQGIGQDLAKKIVRLVKDSKLKVQAAVQGEKVRVTGKKRDDLQQIIALLRETKFEQPLQYENFRD